MLKLKVTRNITDGNGARVLRHTVEPYDAAMTLEAFWAATYSEDRVFAAYRRGVTHMKVKALYIEDDGLFVEVDSMEEYARIGTLVWSQGRRIVADNEQLIYVRLNRYAPDLLEAQ